MLIQTVKQASLINRVPEPAHTGVRVSEILTALSYALDLTEGRPMGHAVRSCMIGMRLAKHLGLSVADQGHLFYALLLKDAGCSSNASKLFHLLAADEIKAKRDVKLTDWTKIGWDSLQYAIGHIATGAPFFERVRTLARIAANQERDSREIVKIRCERGAEIARRIGFAEPVAQAIHSLDEHWNGDGHPQGLKGEEIPLASRILNLAQTLEVFLISRGVNAALDVAQDRSGRWFDPDLVRAAQSLAKDGCLWADLYRQHAIEAVLELEPEPSRLPASQETIENLCQAFAGIVDAKSPFTFRHSSGVADAAVAIARQLDLAENDVTFIRRAALLHDLGKLGVPNTILEKPAKLDRDEWEIVRKHPFHSYEILRRIPGFENLGEVAGAHHEKLDGSGYHRGWGAERLSLEMRILAVADIFDALSARRPYREATPLDAVYALLRKEAGGGIDASCVEALIEAHPHPEPDSGLLNLAETVGPANRTAEPLPQQQEA